MQRALVTTRPEVVVRVHAFVRVAGVGAASDRLARDLAARAGIVVGPRDLRRHLAAFVTVTQ
jgi:hypothetical protein